MELRKRNTGTDRKGFTLTELLVAMGMAALVMTAVFKIYTTQQDSYIVQEQVAEMQQNARTAKYVLVGEMRLAGYDPSGEAGAGIVSAAGNSINITMDITGGENDGIDNDGDGLVDEAKDGNDDDGDGQIDESDEDEDYDKKLTGTGEDVTYAVYTDTDGVNKLGRNEGSGNQPVVENIDAIGFAYAFDADNDGNLDTSAGGNTIWAIDSNGNSLLDANLDTNDDGIISIADNASGLSLATPVSLDSIRAVRIWILARTGRPDRTFSNTATYVLADQRVSPGDSNRRQLVTTTVKLRNMAL